MAFDLSGHCSGELLDLVGPLDRDSGCVQWLDHKPISFTLGYAKQHDDRGARPNVKLGAHARGGCHFAEERNK
jgi:hypothetical protein